jgi:uncharacterized protein (DUF952 family)
MALIFHIVDLAAWDEARSIGLYEPPSLHTEGFIHFSTADQVLRVADNFYRSQPGLGLLVVDTDRLTSPLKWEAPAHPVTVEMPPGEGELFPHLYGPLNVDAATRVLDFPAEPDGTFRLPDDLLPS